LSTHRTLPFARLSILLSCAAALFACAGDQAAPPDPTGTVTSTLRAQGQGAFLIDFDLGAVTTTNGGSPCCTADLALDPNLNFVAGVNSPPPSRRIAGVGAVSALGNVTSVPTAGFVASVSAIVGHGYVVEDGARHWRVYVDSEVIGSVTGGVIGFTIKWAAL
jgi:hypothetical protein